MEDNDTNTGIAKNKLIIVLEKAYESYGHPCLLPISDLTSVLS